MKPQALALVKHLNTGGEVTRHTAWSDFDIQNLTARLSELTALGFDIVKTPFKALPGVRMRDHMGRKIRVTSWKFRHAINPGDLVKVVDDIGTYISLRGRLGRVDKIDLPHALATVWIDDVGFRSLRFKSLRRVALNPGDEVSIHYPPLVVGEYYPQANSYLLLTPKADVTIVAHSSLVRPAAVTADAPA